MTELNNQIDFKALHKTGATYAEWDKGNFGEAFKTSWDDALLSRTDMEFLYQIERKIHVLAIGEPWCGDVQRQLPILAKMCAQNDLLELSIINRDEHMDVMERYLSNGAAAIPVFIFFNDKFVEVGDWRARPAVCRQVIARARAAGELDAAKTAVGEVMDMTQNRLSVEEFKILLDRALSEPGRWQRFLEDAKNRLSPMSSERIFDPKTYEKMVDIFHCQDHIEVCIIQDALEEAGIHFFIQMFQDRVWDGLFEVDKGVAVVQVLEEDAERALEAIENNLDGDELEIEEVD